MKPIEIKRDVDLICNADGTRWKLVYIDPIAAGGPDYLLIPPRGIGGVAAWWLKEDDLRRKFSIARSVWVNTYLKNTGDLFVGAEHETREEALAAVFDCSWLSCIETKELVVKVPLI